MFWRTRFQATIFSWNQGPCCSLHSLPLLIWNSLICLPMLRNPRLRTATNHLITTLSATSLIDTACITLTKLLGNFLATFRISSFFPFEPILALWAISSFLQILRYLNGSLFLGHAYKFCNVSNLVENFLISSKKGAVSSPGEENWRKIRAAGLRDQRFFKENIKMADNDAHTLYWFESFRWGSRVRSQLFPSEFAFTLTLLQWLPYYFYFKSNCHSYIFLL